MNLIAMASARMANFLRWGADAQGSTRPLGLMRIAIATIVFVRFANEVSLYQGDSLSFVLLGLVFFGLTSMMLVGFKAQAACTGVAITLMTMHFYMGKVHGYPGWSSHHIYILVVSVSLLALSPCGRSFSWDRYRALAQAQDAQDIPPERGDLWPQRLIALQLAALYFWAAVDKTNWSFLSGQRIEEAFIWSFTGRALEPLISLGAILAVLSILVVVVEYFLAFAIFVRRWQVFVLPLGLALHAAFYVLLPVNTYSATVMVLYLALLDPDAVHRFLDRMIQNHGQSRSPHRL
jgi:Vitamin K-dependent gamma-carboxylase